MEDGRDGALTAGRVLHFPGWDEPRNMPAEDLKAWLLSKQYEHTQYVAVASTMGGPHTGSRTSSRWRSRSSALDHHQACIRETSHFMKYIKIMMQKYMFRTRGTQSW